MDIDQILFRLTIRHEPDRNCTIARLQDSSLVETLIHYARLHKVAMPALRHLAIWAPEISLSADDMQYLEDRVALRSHYTAELNELARSGVLEPQSVLILKGQAMERWYVNGILRDSSDIDLVVGDEQQVWAVSKWLIQRGYDSLGMGAAYADRDEPGQRRSIVAYWKELSGNSQPTRFEIQDRLTSITLREYFDLTPTMYRARPVHASPLGSGDQAKEPRFFLFPTREDCLISLLVEICERTLTVRDAVDFYMLIQRRSDSGGTEHIDWNRLLDIIEKEALLLQFIRLTHYYLHLSQFALPEIMGRRYRTWLRRYPYWRIATRSPILSYVLPFHLSKHGYAQALQEVLLNLRERIRDSSSLRKVFLRTRLSALRYHSRADHPIVFLLQIGHQGAELVEWRSGPNDEMLLYTPVGVFMATRDIEFTEEFLMEMRNVVNHATFE